GSNRAIISGLLALPESEAGPSLVPAELNIGHQHRSHDLVGHQPGDGLVGSASRAGGCQELRILITRRVARYIIGLVARFTYRRRCASVVRCKVPTELLFATVLPQAIDAQPCRRPDMRTGDIMTTGAATVRPDASI